MGTLDNRRSKFKELSAIDTPIVADGIAKLRARNWTSGFASRDLRCLTPELGILCGYAVTVEIGSMSAETEGGLDEGFVKLCEAITTSCQPTVVVMQERWRHPEFSSHVGEVMCSVFKRIGAIGVVSDGAIRDLSQIRNLGFHCFAPGTIAGYGGLKILRVQTSVTVGGLTIEPGDLLHGDLNGLISVPKAGRKQLLQAIDEIRRSERELLEYIKSKSFTTEDLFKRLGLGR